MNAYGVKRPRVAAIGLGEEQLQSIDPLCGDLRAHGLLEGYLGENSWVETDVVVSSAFVGESIGPGVHVLSIGAASFGWWEHLDAMGGAVAGIAAVHTDPDNTERELSVSSRCPERYRPLASEMARHLSRAGAPPPAIQVGRVAEDSLQPLVVTTSGRPVALRLVRAHSAAAMGAGGLREVTLVLPAQADLAAWFKAFLGDVNEVDPASVPHAPPRLGAPSEWYTPRENRLAKRIAQAEADAERLADERERLEAELASESKQADTGVRRAVSADGDALVEAVAQILGELGFEVRDMDAEVLSGQPKREDLRLTLEGEDAWEAIVEVKGYTSGIKTNDSRQIREHRDRYISDNGGPPAQTLWIANPHRNTDPSSRPSPDAGAEVAASAVGAVCVLSTDLYLLWALVANGRLQASEAARLLADAPPGLWQLPDPA